MSKLGHILFIAVLLLVATAIVGGAGIYGADFYLTAAKERPFHPQYELLKPTGLIGHGYGIIGSLMIITGVLLYSGRKRLRVLSSVGKIKYWLEFHIFLCLTGPALVLYHTTFKFGGLVAVSFWSMVAVVLSGVVGRYLYVQIPKGIQGNELTMNELIVQSKSLSDRLQKEYGMTPALIARVDAIGKSSKPAAQMSTLEVLMYFVMSDLARRIHMRRIASALQRENLHQTAIHHILVLGNARLVLARRIAFLERLRRIFHLWHVIHMPFSIIMFAILLIHVGVAIAFGYRWIW
jgi:hypothetical protein